MGEPGGTSRLCGLGGSWTGVAGAKGYGEPGASVAAEMGVCEGWPGCPKERARFVASEGGCPGKARLRSGTEAPPLAAATEAGERGGGGGGGYSYCWLMLHVGSGMRAARQRGKSPTETTPVAAALVSTGQTPDARRREWERA